MALTIDIKARDDFQKSINAAADALSKVANHEAAVSSLADKIGKSYGVASTQAADLAKHIYAASAATYALEAAGAKANATSNGSLNKQALNEKKITDATKKTTAEEKKHFELLKKGATAIAATGAALVAATSAAAALAYKIGDTAKAAYDSKRESLAMIDAWTGHRGPQALKLIDGLAEQIGMKFEDARHKFLEFREAGLNNKLSFQLLKIRADLMAMGLSAAAADKEVSRVTSVGTDVYARARALNELQRAYKGVGTGAFAAWAATHTLEGAQNRLSNAFSEEAVKLWKDIGPSIGEASNRLADFALKLLKSEAGREGLKAIADAFKGVSDAVNDENLTTGLNVIKTVGATVADVFDYAGTAIGFAASVIVNAMQPVVDMFDNAGQLIGFAASEAVNAVGWISDEIGKLADLAVDMFPNGAAIVDGLIDGIKSRVSAAANTALDLAKDIASSFASSLGIQSPSKLFAGYGRDTVAGFEQGQRRELDAEMPLQKAASKAVQPPAANVINNFDRTQEAARAEPEQRAPAIMIQREPTSPPPERGARAAPSPSITIENLIVQGGGDIQEMARAIRHELQLLLQAGDLSRGLVNV